MWVLLVNSDLTYLNCYLCLCYLVFLRLYYYTNFTISYVDIKLVLVLIFTVINNVLVGIFVNKRSVLQDTFSIISLKSFKLH